MARVLWINGTFGVGKTSTGRRVADLAGLRFYDPETGTGGLRKRKLV